MLRVSTWWNAQKSHLLAALKIFLRVQIKTQVWPYLLCLLLILYVVSAALRFITPTRCSRLRMRLHMSWNAEAKRHLAPGQSQWVLNGLETGCREDCRHFTCQGKPSKNPSLAVSIFLCLCAFGNFALENTDGNDKIIQLTIKKSFDARLRWFLTCEKTVNAQIWRREHICKLVVT